MSREGEFLVQLMYEFKREEMRKSRFRRHLDCGCVIDHGELYSYFVAKVRDVPGLLQVYLCRFCTMEGK